MTDKLLISSYFRGITIQLSIFLGLILVLSPLAALYAQVTIVEWDFENTNPNNPPPIIDINGGASAEAGSGLGNVTVTTAGWQATKWSTTTSPDPNKYFEFKINLTDYKPTELTFLEVRTALKSPSKYEIKYSTDGGSIFMDLLLNQDLSSLNSWLTHTIDLTSIPELVNANPVYFRLYAYQAGASFGPWTIDDVIFKGENADKPPTATLLNTPLPNIPPDFGVYTFQVQYGDDREINVGTLDNNDIQITILPGGSNMSAEFVEVDDPSNGTPRMAIYKLVPSGDWEMGEYTINIVADQVADTQVPSTVVAGSLGTFRVEPVPLATLAADHVTSSGGAEYNFQVEYTDDEAIDIATIGNGEIEVTGPNNFQAVASYVNIEGNPVGNGTPRIVNYKFTVPNPPVGWDPSNEGFYTIAIQADKVKNVWGLPVVAGDLGTFYVDLDNAQPSAVISSPLSNIITPGDTSYPIQVRYTDNVAVNVTTLDDNDIVVISPTNDTIATTKISIDNNTPGTPRLVTYQLIPPGGSWNSAGNGIYKVQLLADQVKDMVNRSAQAKQLGQFEVNIPFILNVSKAGEGIGSITVDGTDCGNTCNKNYSIGNNNANLIATPDKDSLFVGWSGDCDSTSPTLPLAITKDMDCIGTFNYKSSFNFKVNKTGEGTGTITDMISGKIDCGNKCNSVYPKGGQVTLKVTPAEDSYFGGWEGVCKDSPFTMMTDTICTATFHKKPNFTLNINKTGKGSGAITVNGVNCGESCSLVYFEGKAVTLTVTPAENSYLAGWEGDCKDSSFAIMADMNCTANIDIKPPPPLAKTMILTLNKQGTGEGELVLQPNVPPERIDCDADKKQCRYTIDTATWLQVTAKPNSDSRFISWSGSNSQCYPNAGNQLDLFMNEKISCTVQFEGNPKVLTLVKVGNGQIIPSPIGEQIPCETEKCFQFAVNSEVSLTPQAGYNSHFEKWSGDPDCQDGQVQMDADKICVATFGDTPYVNLVLIYDHNQGQIALTPAGENCGDNCQRYKSDTLVTLTAQPQSGFQLASWGSECSDQMSTPLEKTLTQDLRCEITFTSATNPPPIDPSQPFYSLTVNSAGDGLGTITSLPGGINCGTKCTNNYQANTTVTLTAEPAPNSIFVGWSENCPQGQVYVDANQTCTATFAVPGVVSWNSPAQIDVTEEDGQVVLYVSRLGGEDGAVAVDYTITDNTTTADSDYNATAGRLEWATGDKTDKTVTLTILPDKLLEATESLIVTLTNPQGGVQLGTLTTLTVNIADILPFSSIQLAMPEYRVNEGGKKAATVFVTRAGNRSGVVSVDFKIIDGTAVANNDYTSVSGTLTWADGDRTQQAIKIPIISDNLNENPETFTVQLVNLTGEAQLGQYAQATVTIIDTPTMGSLEFAQAEYMVKEAAGKVTIQVDRIGNPVGEVTVNYATTNEGSAQANADFTPSQGMLQWVNGDSEPKFFDIPITVDEQPEGKETVSLSLSNPTGGASLGALSTAMLTITDAANDDTNPPPATEGSVIQFTGPTYEVMEQEAITPLEGLIRVPVMRTGSSKGAATVKYKTLEGTAIVGEHYQPSQGELTWADGETGEKWIDVDTWDNKLKEETKYFYLLLSEPNGATLGEYPQTKVLILDDDSRSVVGFSPKNTYVALENSGQVQVIINRSNSSVGPVSIHYATTDGTATTEDYSPIEGTLTWADGESGEQTISIPLIADQLTEDYETIQLKLFAPQGDVILSHPDEVAVTIIEAETTPCQLTGKVVDCFLMSDTDSPILQDIKITSRGAVSGGRLAGQVENAGRVQNIVLMPNSILMGGQVTGSLSGDSDQPATAFLGYVKLKAAHLEHVVIGEGCQFDQSTTFGEGVLFQTNELVPEQNLAPILGYMEQTVLGQRAVQLNSDVLYLSAIGGLLATINELPQVANRSWQVKLDSRYGFLTLDVGDLRFAALPLQVNQTLKAMLEGISLGMTTQADGQVTFRNQNGREIIAQPVVQNPTYLQEQLHQLGLNVEMLTNGNLKATLADGTYLIGRAGLAAQRVSKATTLGLHYTEQPAYLVFEDEQGQRWQQTIYPAAAYPQILTNQTEEAILTNEGQLQVRQGERIYQGQLDYLVVTGEKQSRSGSNNLQFKEIADVDGDHCGDYQIIYSSQESQILFGQCSSR